MRHAPLHSRAFTKAAYSAINVRESLSAIVPRTPATASPGTASSGCLHGLKRYLLTSTDLSSRFGFAVGVSWLTSARASLACRLQQLLFPLPAQHSARRDGHEFALHFDQALKLQNIPHSGNTYPRTPKMNAHCERFNRTIQEEFVDYHEELLFYDLPAFNDRLLHWLTWYNLERPTPCPRTANSDPRNIQLHQAPVQDLLAQ